MSAIQWTKALGSAAVMLTLVAIGAGASAADDLKDVPYTELVERGLAQGQAELDNGALYYLRAAAGRPEARTDPRVFVALAYLERKACRLDIALRQARRADEIAREADSPLQGAAARLLGELERGGGWVHVDLRHVEDAGEPDDTDGIETDGAPSDGMTANPSSTKASNPSRPAPAAKHGADAPSAPEAGAPADDAAMRVVLDDDGRALDTLVARAPDGPPQEPACVERAEALLTAGIARRLEAADGVSETVQVRLPVGSWYIAGRPLTVAGRSETPLALELVTPDTGLSGSTWVAIGGSVAAAAALATVGALVLAPAETRPTLRGTHFQ